jgi:uncharacterized damage-inducible protein DinB
MSRVHLLEGLKRSPVILQDFVAAIPADALDRRRGDGFWTIYEHLLHLVETQEVILGRLERIRDSDHPVITPFVPRELPRAKGVVRPSAGELVRQFTGWRERQLELIEAAPESLWQKPAEHPEYERYGFEILVRHTLLHDGQHLARIEELWLFKDGFVTVW